MQEPEKKLNGAPRQVEIYLFEITKIELPDVHFEIACSKGTYIRVIADDFGKELGCGGILSLLRRTEIGDYKIDDAFNLDEFTSMFNVEK